MTSVFDLLGRDEVDLTAALGWTLAQSPALMTALWARLRLPGTPTDVQSALELSDSSGRTDLQLIGETATAVIEAKKGWLLPDEVQLAKYTSRVPAGHQGLLVSLSDSSAAWAKLHLPAHIDDIPIRHLPWDEVRTDVRAALWTTRGAEKQWLTELATYLAGATAVRDPAEQWVYCVVVSNGTPSYSSRTYRQYLQQERVYFHPFGKNWPKRPPVLLAFRWGGLVRQVNRVQATVVPQLQTRWPDLPRGNAAAASPHVLYDLGPDIPIPSIPTKGTFGNARVWTLLDQMLIQPTLQDAVRASKQLIRPTPS